MRKYHLFVTDVTQSHTPHVGLSNNIWFYEQQNLIILVGVKPKKNNKSSLYASSSTSSTSAAAVAIVSAETSPLCALVKTSRRRVIKPKQLRLIRELIMRPHVFIKMKMTSWSHSDLFCLVQSPEELSREKKWRLTHPHGRGRRGWRGLGGHEYIRTHLSALHYWPIHTLTDTHTHTHAPFHLNHTPKHYIPPPKLILTITNIQLILNPNSNPNSKLRLKPKCGHKRRSAMTLRGRHQIQYFNSHTSF